MKPLLVVALGGNALLRRGERMTAEAHQRNAATAAAALAALVHDFRLVITHGNGPQVGLLAAQSMQHHGAFEQGLDVLDAETEGMIGYLLAQELGNAVPDIPIATLLTRVEVDADDPAFRRPTKPIGAVTDKDGAERLGLAHRWTFAPDGSAWRRVVPSPEPKAIVEQGAVETLLTGGHVVICAGGGGIPVVRTGRFLHGVEAVVDKDLTSSLLATRIGADHFVMLTDVPGIQRGWGTPDAELIQAITPTELRSLDLAAGSMRPKAEAACRFVERAGRFAAIGAIEDADSLARGMAGTVVTDPLAVEVRAGASAVRTR